MLQSNDQTGPGDTSLAESYFDEAAASIMNRVKNATKSNNTAANPSLSSSSSVVTQHQKEVQEETRGRTKSTTATATKQDRKSTHFHRESQSRDIRGWLQGIGLQEMAVRSAQELASVGNLSSTFLSSALCLVFSGRLLLVLLLLPCLRLGCYPPTTFSFRSQSLRTLE